MPWVVPENSDHPEEDRRWYPLWLIDPPLTREDWRKFFVRLAHPVRWVRWRLQLHRQGPYTPDFGDYLEGTWSDDVESRPEGGAASGVSLPGGRWVVQKRGR